MSDRPDGPTAEDVPQPEPAGPPAEPIVAEPRGPEPVVEPIPVQPAAPVQIAPEAGGPPVMAEPPAPDAVPEPESRGPHMAEPGAENPQSGPAGGDEGRTEETLALPPATSPNPPPPSQPDHMSALEGVAVPFAAPPTERNNGRFAAALSIGIGGGFVIILAVVIALFVSIFTLTESYMEKIEDTAGAFMSDVADEQWDAAYARLCPDLRERPVEDYIADWESWEADGADVQPVREEMSGTYVPVELADGSTVELEIELAQGETIETTVCGWEHSGA